MRQPIRFLLAGVLILLITGLASSAALRTTTGKRANVVEGTVVCAESGLPLQNGVIVVDGQEYAITDGHYHLELPRGNYQATVRGPYRKDKQVMITANAKTTTQDIQVESYFSQQEIDTLAKITRAEAEGESSTGKLAVAATVLNRVNNPRYPDSISGVVYQRVSGRYQYSPVADGRINLAPRSSDYQAAYTALSGNDPTYGATGFYNPAKTRDRWVRSHPVTTVIGDHTFFKY